MHVWSRHSELREMEMHVRSHYENSGIELGRLVHLELQITQTAYGRLGNVY